MTLETKRVLITVKAYPNPSKKHQETVCCAGIDLDTGKWIRLYPIPFRDLDESKQFKKYNIISVKCAKTPKDKRVESYKVDSDSIRLIDYIDTKNNWEKRRQFVLPAKSSSFCSIFEKTKENKSLGMFKASNIGFNISKAALKNEKKRQACYAQLTFFDRHKDAIEQIPYNFYYTFKCDNEKNCTGHKLLIIDWELGQAFRDWRNRYDNEKILLEKIKEKWLDDLCSSKNDVYFFVGNIHRFVNTFMVLGVFYPPKSASPLFQ